MTMKRKAPKKSAHIPVSRIQYSATVMLPFYRAIAEHPKYASAWSKAVIAADLDKMGVLLGLASRKAMGLPLGSNGIGYFISFPTKHSISELTNGTTIIPGSVQFYFNTRVHRMIARAVTPLYTQLAYNRPFAAALSRAAGVGDVKAVNKMVRALVKSKALIRVEAGIEDGGIALNFKPSCSPYIYRNLLFLESL
ncbi:hypothetical protein TCA2_3112 [Paenibacillus sp. TCA20]|uniref:hypothetical protein n=1 Tax=Paenibacillus TaxID=44249 RepID=UPI0004D3A61C|nr:hypothetical protein [Paenibacillus sp. TCA20]GAK40622.1 hypothetical protein TCA2_3112 [Paenibacillus sp. TCA20]